jgi:hypothetical protein
VPVTVTAVRAAAASGSLAEVPAGPCSVELPRSAVQPVAPASRPPA